MRNIGIGMIVLVALIAIALPVAALNSRTILPVTVAPQNNAGALTPNTTYAYNFVFAASTACVPLLNVSANITTDNRGIGSADLNITPLATVPSYVCEYVNGTLRTTHPVFSSLFENKTTDAEIAGFGYNHTADLDARYCFGNGTNCQASLMLSEIVTNIGNWSADRAVYNATTQLDTRYCLGNGTNCQAGLSISQTAANIGNWSADKAALPNITFAQVAGTLGNWSSDRAAYNTTTQLDTRYCFGNGSNCQASLTFSEIVGGIGNWSADKLTLANITFVQVATTLGNWSNDRGGYVNTTMLTNCSAGQYLAWNGTAFSCNVDNTGLTLATITTNIGNWSADKTTLPNLTLGQVAASIGNYSQSASSYEVAGSGNLSRWNGTTFVSVLDQIGTANASWNETRANSLYYGITNPSSFIANATTGNLTYVYAGGINLTTTQLAEGANLYYTDTRVATAIQNTSILRIGATNQTIVSCANITGAASNLCTLIDIDTNSGYTQWRIGLSTGNTTAITNNTLLNITAGAGISITQVGTGPVNLTITNTGLLSESDAIALAQIGTLPNITFAQVATTLGNWSADKNAYNTTNQLDVRYCFGNGTNCQASLTFSEIITGIGNWSADKTTLPNITLAQVANTLGNWSSDKANVAWRLGIGTGNTSNVGNSTLLNITAGNGIVLTQVGTGPINLTIASDINLNNNGNWSADKGALPNITFAQVATTLGNWSADKTTLPNITLAQVAANIGNYTQSASEYQVAGVGNISKWNGTTIISVVDVTVGDNSSWNETRANTLYYAIGNPSVYISDGNTGWDNSYGLIANATTGNLTYLYTGGTNLTTAQIAETDSLYYTDARVATAIQNTSILRIGATNQTIVSCANITGAASNLCTLIDTNTGYTQWRVGIATGNNSALTNNTLLNITAGSGIVLTQVGTGPINLTIASDINLNNNGNWSADKTGLPNLTLAQITANTGNWSADKANVAWRLGIATGNATNIANSTVLNISAGTGITLTQTGTGPVNITISANLNDNGNWSSDKTALPNITFAQVATTLGNWSADKANQAWLVSSGSNTTTVSNDTLVNFTAGPGIAITQTGTGPVNITIASSDLYNYTTTDVITSDAVNYNTTVILTLGMAASSTYIIDCQILNDAAAVGTGVQLRVNTTGTPTSVRTTWTSHSSATAMESFTGVSTSSNAFADGGSSSAQVGIGLLNGYIVTSGNPSVWTVEVKTEVGASVARVRAGSFCRATKVA